MLLFASNFAGVLIEQANYEFDCDDNDESEGKINKGFCVISI